MPDSRPATSQGAPALAVVIESGARRTFASALDWPGWCRSGRGEEAALDALRAYASRYAPVVDAAGLQPPDPARIAVVERLPGSASTDFGVPSAIAGLERAPITADAIEPLVRVLEACWALFDRVAGAAPAGLRKGPRGGGRDRDTIIDHVVGAEAEAYAPKLGVRLARPRPGDLAAIGAAREALVGALRSGAAGGASPPGRWPSRYAFRRIAWHVLDHAWEIEDRSAPGSAPPSPSR